VSPRLVIATLAAGVLLSTPSVQAGDLGPRAQIDLATALELANASRWPESLAVLDRLVIAEPAWAEAYFVRAGVLANIAGDASTREALSKLDRSVDYVALAAILERSASDLEHYLALDTTADNLDQVRAAIAALEARAIVARTHAREVAAQIEAESDAAVDRVAPLAMQEITHSSRVGVDVALAAMSLPASMNGGGTTTGLLVMPSGAWAIRPTLKATVALPVFLGSYQYNAANDDGEQELGNLILAGVWLRDLHAAAQRLRLAVGGRLSLGNEHDQSLVRPASLMTGTHDPLAFEHGSAIELRADLRLVRDRTFAQTEFAAALLSPPAGTGIAIRLALGGGVRLGRSAALLATITAATTTSDTPWLDSDRDSSPLASDLQLALAIGGTTIGAAIPMTGAGPVTRGVMLTARYGHTMDGRKAPRAGTTSTKVAPAPNPADSW